MKRLLIRLPSNTASLDMEHLRLPFVLLEKSNDIESSGNSPIHELPRTDGQINTLIVPASCLSWHSVRFPSGVLGRRFWQRSSDSKIATLIENLLEDDLLDDPKNLHFSLQTGANSQDELLVAVCDKLWLSTGIGALQSGGIAIHRITPEICPIEMPKSHRADPSTDESTHPSEAVEFYVQGDPDHPTIVQRTSTAVTHMQLDAQTIKICASSASALLFAEPTVAGIAEELFQKEPIIVPHGHRYMQAGQSSWNLAQFEFAEYTRSPRNQRIKRAIDAFLKEPTYYPARLCLALIVVINVVGLNINAWWVNHQLSQQQQEIYQAVRKTFPDITTIIDAPLQMKRAVEQIKSSQGVLSSGDFESLMNAYGRASQGKFPLPSAIKYSQERHEIHLQDVSLGQQDMDTLRRYLKPLGYDAKSVDSAIVIGGVK